MYGTATGCAPAAAYYAGRGPLAMRIGQAVPEPSVVDKLKDFGNQETMGVANWKLGLGAALVGVGIYGYTHRWF